VSQNEFNLNFNKHKIAGIKRIKYKLASKNLNGLIRNRKD
jgi:hypothetical protein